MGHGWTKRDPEPLDLERSRASRVHRFVLFHDPVRDLHLMLDASLRLLENESEEEPGEPALPLAFS